MLAEHVHLPHQGIEKDDSAWPAMSVLPAARTELGANLTRATVRFAEITPPTSSELEEEGSQKSPLTPDMVNRRTLDVHDISRVAEGCCTACLLYVYVSPATPSISIGTK